MQEVACGILRLSEAEFEASTYYGLTVAYVGYCKSRGIGVWAKRSGDVGAPWSEGQVRRARAGLAEMKARFPDGPAPADAVARARARRAAKRG